jgi:predicted metal-binding protein
LASHYEEAQLKIIPQHMMMMMMMMKQTTKIIQSIHLSNCLLTDTAHY